MWHQCCTGARATQESESKHGSTTDLSTELNALLISIATAPDFCGLGACEATRVTWMPLRGRLKISRPLEMVSKNWCGVTEHLAGKSVSRRCLRLQLGVMNQQPGSRKGTMDAPQNKCRIDTIILHRSDNETTSPKRRNTRSDEDGRKASLRLADLNPVEPAPDVEGDEDKAFLIWFASVPSGSSVRRF